jgi:hypothetical protein
MTLYLLSNYLRKFASDLETQRLSEQDLKDIHEIPDDPTILNLYAEQRTEATNNVVAAFFTPISNQKWSTYHDEIVFGGLTTKSPKYAFPFQNVIYVNLNIKTLQQNHRNIVFSLFEICTHEIGHILWNKVHSNLSISIDEESFADIVKKYVAPRKNEPFSQTSAPKQYADLQFILNDLRHKA